MHHNERLKQHPLDRDERQAGLVCLQPQKMAGKLAPLRFGGAVQWQTTLQEGPGRQPAAAPPPLPFWKGTSTSHAWSFGGVEVLGWVPAAAVAAAVAAAAPLPFPA